MKYLAVGNNELREPLGDTATCPHCGEQHPVENSDPPTLQFVRCGESGYLVGVDGRRIEKYD